MIHIDLILSVQNVILRSMEPMQSLQKIANRGFFTLKSCLEQGVSRYELRKLETDGKIQKVDHGLYMLDGTIDDEMFMPQVLNENIVYSHETALFLLGFSDLIPDKYTITVPLGYHSKKLWNNFYVRQTPAELLNKGVVEIDSLYGNPIKVYCIERTLCEMMHSRKDFTKERFIPAIQRYMRLKGRNIGKVVDFSRMFNVERKIRPYVEALI